MPGRNQQGESGVRRMTDEMGRNYMSWHWRVAAQYREWPRTASGVSWLIAAACLAVVHPLASGEPQNSAAPLSPHLWEVEDVYSNRVEEIQLEFAGKMQNLHARYAGALQRLAQSYRRSGRQRSERRVRSELQRYGATATVPYAAEPSFTPEMRRLHAKAAGLRHVAEKTCAARLRDAHADYLNALARQLGAARAGSGEAHWLMRRIEGATRQGPAVLRSHNGLAASYCAGVGSHCEQLRRVDPSVSFAADSDWLGGIVKDTGVSVRWRGYLVPPRDSIYVFALKQDDAVARMAVRDRHGNVVASIPLSRRSAESRQIALHAGEWYRISVEYAQLDARQRRFSLEWREHGGALRPIPRARLFPATGRRQHRLPVTASRDLERVWLYVVNRLEGDDKAAYQALDLTRRRELVRSGSHRLVLAYQPDTFQPTRKPASADWDRVDFVPTRALQHDGRYSDGERQRDLKIRQWVAGPANNPTYRWLLAVDGEPAVDLIARPSDYPRPAWPPTFEPTDPNLLSPLRSNVAANTLFLMYRDALQERRRIGRWLVTPVVERDLLLQERHESTIMQREWYLDRLIILLTRRVTHSELVSLLEDEIGSQLHAVALSLR
jgi:hypothetical protein